MTDEEKLAYAKKNYPIGTRYKMLDSNGNLNNETEVTREARLFGTGNMDCGIGYLYIEKLRKWAPIVSEVTNEEYVLI